MNNQLNAEQRKILRDLSKDYKKLMISFSGGGDSGNVDGISLLKEEPDYTEHPVPRDIIDAVFTIAETIVYECWRFSGDGPTQWGTVEVDLTTGDCDIYGQVEEPVDFSDALYLNIEETEEEKQEAITSITGF